MQKVNQKVDSISNLEKIILFLSISVHAFHGTIYILNGIGLVATEYFSNPEDENLRNICLFVWLIFLVLSINFGLDFCSRVYHYLFRSN